MSSRRRRFWIALAVTCALVAHGRSLASDRFSYDDREAIVENPVVRGDLPWSSVVDRDYWHHRGAVGHYRPTATALLRLDYAVHGPRPRGFRATNLLLFAVLVGLLASLVLARAPDLVPLGVLLFAVHPALADSVGWISGRTSMASALPLVLAAWWIHRRRDARALELASVAFVGAVLGLGGKEDAVALFPALVLLAHGRRGALATAAGALVGLAVVLGARQLVYGSPLPAAADAPLAQLGLLERLAFGGRALAEATRVALWPFGLPPSYRGAAAFDSDTPRSFAWALPSLALLLGVVLLAGSALRRVAADRPRSDVATCLLCAGVALVPLTQVLPLGEPFAPRFLFLPLLALAPLLSVRRAALWIVPVILAFAVGAFVRSADYADRASHARAVLAHHGDDPVAWTSLGLALAEEGRTDEAERTLREAVARFPDHGRAWSNLAAIELERGDLDAGIQSLRRSLRAFPRNGIAWANLGNALLRSGDPEAAVEAYERATQVLPGAGSVWRGLGAALQGSGRPRAALEALERALELDPGDELARQRKRSLERKGI